MKRHGSDNHQFIQRIPADVKPRAAGLKLHVPVGPNVVRLTISPSAQALRISLRTSDPKEARARAAQVAAYVETVWQAIRGEKPLPLTHRQAVALAGELYAVWSTEKATSRTTAVIQQPDGSFAPDPDHGLDDPDQWDAVNRYLAGQEEDPEAAMGPLVDRLLLTKGIRTVDPGSRQLLLTAFLSAMQDAVSNRKRNAAGDYSHDPVQDRFPKWEDPRQPVGLTITGMFEAWWKEAKQGGRAEGTYENYSVVIKHLTDYLKHDDAGKVTAADIIGFKDHRLAQGLSVSTVGGNNLGALKSVFGWAFDNKLITTDPTLGVKVRRAKTVKLRKKGFNPREAKALLEASCKTEKRPREHITAYYARRWVPWLCAYTGARVGEILQLRGEDIRQEKDGTVIITITPEAGTVKNKEKREVVLHEHLIAIGFVDFWRGTNAKYLFIPAGQDVRQAISSVTARLIKFVREQGVEKGVSPNHGWRHLFKTLGRKAGIEDSILDAICGHAPSTEGGRYGWVDLETQKAAIAKLPRFRVDLA